MSETTQRKPVKRPLMNPEKAVNIIAAAVKEALAVIAAAAREAKQVVSSDVGDATRLLASNAADAARVTNVKSGEDHDLLIELRTNMKLLREDVKGLKDGNVAVKDFEDLKDKFDKKNDKQDQQIDDLEKKTANYTITMVLYSIAVVGMISLTIFHILSMG